MSRFPSFLLRAAALISLLPLASSQALAFDLELTAPPIPPANVGLWHLPASDFHLTVTNPCNSTVNATIQSFVYHRGELVARTNLSDLSPVHVPPGSSSFGSDVLFPPEAMRISSKFLGISAPWHALNGPFTETGSLPPQGSYELHVQLVGPDGEGDPGRSAAIRLGGRSESNVLLHQLIHSHRDRGESEEGGGERGGGDENGEGEDDEPLPPSTDCNLPSRIVEKGIFLPPFNPPTLMLPHDGQEQHVDTPILLDWAPSASLSSQDIAYRVQVFEIAPGQTPASVYLNEPPVLDHVVGGVSHLTWPSAVPSPRRGFSYVWSVQALDRAAEPIGRWDGRATPFVFHVPFRDGDGGGDTILATETGDLRESLNERLDEGQHQGSDGWSLGVFGSSEELCDNGGFETGTFQGWTGWTGGLGSTPRVPGLMPGRHRLLVPGADPNVLPSVLPVLPLGGGNAHSARLGNDSTGAESEGLDYRLIVDADTSFLRFSFAPVLEDPGHDPIAQPFFSFRIVKTSDGTELSSFIVRADTSNPFFQQQGDVVFKPWDCFGVDLSDSIGEEVEIQFQSADCLHGDHWGYVYLDGLCGDAESTSPIARLTVPSEPCIDGPIHARGTASEKDTAHHWSIVEIDTSGQAVGTPLEWGGPVPAADLDLTLLADNGFFTFECDRSYLVTLIVENACGSDTISRVFEISPCPEADAGRDYDCETPVTIGTPALPGYTYSWSPTVRLSDPDVAMPQVLPGGPTIYTVTATSPEGCVATDSVLVGPAPPSVSIRAERLDACVPVWHLIADTVGGGDVLWSTGETTRSIVAAPHLGTTYDVTTTNDCGSASASHTLTLGGAFLGPFPPIVAPEWFTPGIPGPNDFFAVVDSTLPLEAMPAYNASGAQLSIFERWGSKVCDLRFDTIDGFFNGEIGWDGNRCNNNSTPASTRVYVWLLFLENCDQPLQLVGHGEIDLIR
ncbi:MAG: hypothetical protein AAF533_28020 [Acidobacteriota bacterium]